MKRMYENVEVMITDLEVEDVVRTSGGTVVTENGGFLGDMDNFNA